MFVWKKWESLRIISRQISPMCMTQRALDLALSAIYGLCPVEVTPFPNNVGHHVPERIPDSGLKVYHDAL